MSRPGEVRCNGRRVGAQCLRSRAVPTDSPGGGSVGTDLRLYRPSMTRRSELDLEAALRLNGATVDSGRYRGVAVREAPRWMVAVWGKGVAAMALPHTVYATKGTLERITSGSERRLLTHESVHVDQWRRYGRIRFLTRYFGDYLRGRAVGLPHGVAYRAIRFERQAVEQSES